MAVQVTTMRNMYVNCIYTHTHSLKGDLILKSGYPMTIIFQDGEHLKKTDDGNPLPN